VKPRVKSSVQRRKAIAERRARREATEELERARAAEARREAVDARAVLTALVGEQGVA
jgi:hypothetical protein